VTKIAMGLRNLMCLLPAETPDPGHHGWAEEETEQPGTSYANIRNEAESFPYREAARGRDKVNCSSDSAQMFACFRAGATNLVSLIRECALYALVKIGRMLANLFRSRFKRSWRH
jgi:hypothetical protein